ncbi:MAG TPA: hypothetical protein VGF24_29365 [Vicinamibacterales bacterium]|jgi:hypothetical protein
MTDYSPFTGRRADPPKPVLVQRLWRVTNAHGSVLSCGLYLHPYGIEARCGYGSEDNFLMSQVERTPQAARERADEWLATALSRGFAITE